MTAEETVVDTTAQPVPELTKEQEQEINHMMNALNMLLSGHPVNTSMAAILNLLIRKADESEADCAYMFKFNAAFSSALQNVAQNLVVPCKM